MLCYHSSNHDLNLLFQILSQCTHKLGLASAARKIFTEDGTLVMEIDDLIDWAVENYKSLMVDQLERILHGKENTTAEGKTGSTLNVCFWRSDDNCND